MATTPVEHVYYADKAIWVTDQRIITAGWNHWYKQMRNVRMESVAPGKRDLLWTSAFLLLVACVSFVQRLAAVESYKSTGDTIGTFTDGMFWAITIVALIAFVGTFFFFLLVALKGVFYSLSISTGLSSRIIFASMDGSLAEQILNEIAHARLNANAGIAPANPRSAPPAPPISQDTRIQARAPTIVGEQVTAGSTTVSLSDVKSAKVGATYVRPWWLGFVAFQVTVLLNSLTQYAYQHWRTDFWLWLSTLTCFILLIGIGVFVVGLLRSLDSKVYTVNMRGTFGNVMAYATLDKEEAQEVKAEIDRALQSRSQPLSTQPSAMG